MVLVAGLALQAPVAAQDAGTSPQPQPAVDTWQLPFALPDRRALRSITVVSVFGAARQSYVRGHIHTGLDLVPRRPGRGPIEVLAMAPGRVCSIHLSDPHLTVVVEHRLLDGTTLFTSYKHLARADVVEGQQVTAATRVGVLYTRAQARELGGNYDHLHLEIRTRFDDAGAASWTTMTRQELARRFVDPLVFLKQEFEAREVRSRP